MNERRSPMMPDGGVATLFLDHGEEVPAVGEELGVGGDWYPVIAVVRTAEGHDVTLGGPAARSGA